ncbi:TM2 domain-containing protein [Ramlibacter sp. RBP-2]|uniref:TM2 domain-containing protein n=1 Tax=Ramlibacter lithotrophicus TaxID=2606681 RepID=A0A7X6DHU0_9BURK|nr:NINE protein [Ramlibacter lithotrophicus]NKE67437.1 TM2 domain-containing protein [Ramlibacter lithotrophicus]
MKNKTLAAWLAFLGGPLGLHRFYLHGWRDAPGWILPLPTLLGAYGVLRVQRLGVDDQLSWMLVPLLGFTIAGCALTAIVYGLSSREKWNARFNAGADEQAPAGGTNWFTILAVAAALMVGTGILMATIAFSFQHYFEYQVEEGRAISQ